MSFLEKGEADGAFSSSEYASLQLVEQENFWFRIRNELIQWAIRSQFPNARTLLEVGCGHGYVLGALEHAFPNLRLSGSELSVEGLRTASNRLDHSTLYQFDARAIPFEREFDVVCAFDVLEHVDEDETVLEQMRRAATAAGGVLITVPQHPWLWSGADDRADHRRRYTRRELLEKVRAAGLTEIMVTSFATTVLPLMALSRMRWRFSRRTYDISDEHRQAQRIGALLESLMRTDVRLIRRGWSLPAGGSLLVAATP